MQRPFHDVQVTAPQIHIPHDVGPVGNRSGQTTRTRDKVRCDVGSIVAPILQEAFLPQVDRATGHEHVIRCFSHLIRIGCGVASRHVGGGRLTAKEQISRGDGQGRIFVDDQVAPKVVIAALLRVGQTRDVGGIDGHIVKNHATRLKVLPIGRRAGCRRALREVPHHVLITAVGCVPVGVEHLLDSPALHARGIQKLKPYRRGIVIQWAKLIGSRNDGRNPVPPIVGNAEGQTPNRAHRRRARSTPASDDI